MNHIESCGIDTCGDGLPCDCPCHDGYQYDWDSCPEHIWKDVDDMSGRGVECIHCGIPGELDDMHPGGVYYPAT